MVIPAFVFQEWQVHLRIAAASVAVLGVVAARLHCPIVKALQPFTHVALRELRSRLDHFGDHRPTSNLDFPNTDGCLKNACKLWWLRNSYFGKLIIDDVVFVGAGAGQGRDVQQWLHSGLPPIQFLSDRSAQSTSAAMQWGNTRKIILACVCTARIISIPALRHMAAARA
jgi:hypothetical protein